MVWPVLLGLGMLAGNQALGQYFRDARQERLADRYAGLLGAAPGPMGPPTESGEMGYSGGRGLLADPTSMQKQLEFAAGVAKLPGQQAAGLNLLNAAFGRAQQAQENQSAADRWNKQFDFGREQYTQGQANWARQFEAGRQDAQAQADRWLKDFEARQGQWNQTNEQWLKDFGLRERGETRMENAAGNNGIMGTLPAGYMYAPGPGGGAIVAPMPGTPDYAKATQGAESLAGAMQQVGELRNLLEGKEQTSKDGNKVRTGGYGTQMTGQVAQQYSMLRGQLITQLGVMNQAGVIDKGEYERYADRLPDPSTFGSYFTRNSTIGASYEALGTELQRKLDQHYKANPWLIPPVPEGFVAAGNAGNANPASSAPGSPAPGSPAPAAPGGGLLSGPAVPAQRARGRGRYKVE